MPGLRGQEQENKTAVSAAFLALQTARTGMRCLMVEDDYGPWDD